MRKYGSKTTMLIKSFCPHSGRTQTLARKEASASGPQTYLGRHMVSESRLRPAVFEWEASRNPRLLISKKRRN